MTKMWLKKSGSTFQVPAISGHSGCYGGKVNDHHRMSLKRLEVWEQFLIVLFDPVLPSAGALLWFYGHTEQKASNPLQVAGKGKICNAFFN